MISKIQTAPFLCYFSVTKLVSLFCRPICCRNAGALLFASMKSMERARDRWEFMGIEIKWDPENQRDRKWKRWSHKFLLNNFNRTSLVGMRHTYTHIHTGFCATVFMPMWIVKKKQKHISLFTHAAPFAISIFEYAPLRIFSLNSSSSSGGNNIRHQMKI